MSIWGGWAQKTYERIRQEIPVVLVRSIQDPKIQTKLHSFIKSMKFNRSSVSNISDSGFDLLFALTGEV
jgi:hypothetical protein